MGKPIPKLSELSSVDVTLDAPQPNTAATTAMDADGSSLEAVRTAPVVLTEESRPELTRETEALLRGRLRLAAGLLFFAFLAFLPRHFFQRDLSSPGGASLFAFHLFDTIAMGVLAAMLCRRCEIPLSRLRTAELAMFGLSAAFLCALQNYTILADGKRLLLAEKSIGLGQAALVISVEMWLLLVFTYALFVPNTWRRAAAVIGIIAAAPLVMIAVTALAHAEVRQLLTLRELTGVSLTMAVAAVIGLFGVDTIGSLRREAFEARRLGRYQLTKRIGVGGMGEVYLAEHQLMKRPCVVKLIRPDKNHDPKMLARFQREVRATAKLSHWNTVEIFDYGSTEDGTFYYVMEYLPGMSLGDLVARFGPLPPERAIHLLRQACDALGEAHAAGLIHRDIKPANIFTAKRGGVYDVAKLLDFGLVKPLADERPIQLTGEGSITGSPLFLSPEQATGDSEPDARSDIYSLGAVAYYLLTGKPPFEGEKPIKVLIAHAHDEPVPPSQHRRDLPADVESIVLRCLAKRPDDRFADAAGLATALADCEAADRWTRDLAAAWWKANLKPL